MTKRKSDLELKQNRFTDKWPQLYALNLSGKSWTEIAEEIGVTPRQLADAKRRYENKIGKLVTDPVEHRRRLIATGWHALSEAVSRGDARGASMLMRELSRLGGANAEVSPDTGAATVVTGPVQIVIAPSERGLPKADDDDMTVADAMASLPLVVAPAGENRLTGKTVFSDDEVDE